MVAAQHIVKLVDTTQQMFASMLHLLSNQSQLAIFNAGENLTSKKDLPNQLVEYSYLLFVLHQLHQPTNYKILKWLQTWNGGMLESILHMDHYKDGIDKLRTSMKQHTPRQVIGIDCIKNGTNIKLIDSKRLLFCMGCKQLHKCMSSCSKVNHLSVCDYDLLTSAICKMGILQYLDCNTFANDIKIEMCMFDTVINQVTDQFKSFDDAGLQLSEIQAYFATHIIYAHTAYGTMTHQSKFDYSSLTTYMMSTMPNFISMGHIEIIGEYAATLRILANGVENDELALSILYIMSRINTESYTITVGDVIANRRHKHTNYKSHLQWCAVTALIPTVKLMSTKSQIKYVAGDT